MENNGYKFNLILIIIKINISLFIFKFKFTLWPYSIYFFYKRSFIRGHIYKCQGVESSIKR